MAKLPKKINLKVNISELVGNVENITEIKKRKNGEITPKELIRIVLNELLDNEIEEIAIVRRYKDGSISTGWTTDNAIEALGMAELLKIHIADDIE